MQCIFIARHSNIATKLGTFLPVSFNSSLSGFGGLEVACWLLVHKFAGFALGRSRRNFKAKKPSARLPSEEK
jgi:hypothetical protein